MSKRTVGDELRDLADRIEGHVAIAPHEVRGIALRADYAVMRATETGPAPSLGAGSAGDVEIVCPCGHGIDNHTWAGCAAYVQPTIGGAGACCTRNPTQVVLASDWLADLLARASTADRERVARVEALIARWQHTPGHYCCELCQLLAALAAPHVERRCWCGSPVGYRPDKGFHDCLADRMHDWRGKELAALAGLKEPTT